jgi:ribosomal protein S18 acetylase RimI-like enzyme
VGALPAPLREAALFPEFDLPLPPAGHPYRIRQFDGYQLGYTKGSSYAMVCVRRTAEGKAADVVAEVRSLLAVEGFERAAWVVSEAAEPAGLAERLLDQGLVPWEREAEGFEPRYRNMLLTREPEAPESVVARHVETVDEFVAAARVAQDAFDISEQDRRLFEERQAELWEWQERLPDFKTFAAFIDGEIVGNASAIFGRNAVYMVGGSVRADARGRGAYRALVRARWDAAVARGTPALTVTAGAQSGPVLDRLGFTTLGWGDVLSDRFRGAGASSGGLGGEAFALRA